MEYKIAIIACYFGRLPEYTQAFLLSCENNANIDWIIFSDCDASTIHIPNNVRIIHIELSAIKKKIEDVVGFQISLEKAYKLCDYKPVYGNLFSDYLVGYDFWGYCDLDVIWGKTTHFLTPDVLSSYDKIYLFGHLSIIRNKKEFNSMFMVNEKNSLSHSIVFSEPKSFYFDEIDYNKKWFSTNGKVYKRIDFFDRSDVYRNRVISVDKKIMEGAFPNSFMELLEFPKNHLFQIVSWERGHIYRYYLKWFHLEKEEYCYIHFRSNIKMPEKDVSHYQDYYITVDKLIPKKNNITILDIIKYNCPRLLLENNQFNNFMIRQFQRRRIYDITKDTLYRIRPLRILVHWIKDIWR